MTEITLVRTVGSNSHTFTFPEGMVKNVHSALASEIMENNMPGSGPALNIGIDFNGVTKVITISGELNDADTSVVTGTSAPTITTVKLIKLYLESFLSGQQQAIPLTSNYETWALESPGGTTTIDGQAIPGTWVLAKIYMTAIDFDDNSGEPNIVPYSISLWVAGA